MSPLATSISIALLLASSLTLLAAVVGVLFMPRPDRQGDAFLDQPFQPWAAERCGNEDLRNCVSLELPSGEARSAAGRMYAMPPTDAERSQRRLPRFFRRAL